MKRSSERRVRQSRECARKHGLYSSEMYTARAYLRSMTTLLIQLEIKIDQRRR